MVKLILGGLAAIGMLGLAALVFVPHYATAVKNQLGEAIENWISPDLHAEAAREKLKAAESKVVKAMATSDEEFKTVDETRSQFVRTQKQRADLTQRIVECRDLLEKNRSTLLPERLALVENEVALLKKAFEQVSAREADLRERCVHASDRHEELKVKCRDLVAKIDYARTNLESQVSRNAIDHANSLVNDADKMIGEFAGRVDRQTYQDHVLGQLREQGLPKLPSRGELTSESLISQLNGLLQK